MANDLVALRNVSKVYGHGSTQIRALSSIDLSIGAGEFCSIMGSSGSGKSTALSIMGGLDKPSRGNYFLDKTDINTYSDLELARIRNRKIGFVFQRFHLLTQLTALENVALPMIYAGIPYAQRIELAIEALNKVNLSHKSHSKPNQLSGGQQQRVAIARAIVNKPVILLADEPTGSLDSNTSLEIMNIFKTLNSDGMTIVIVTHEFELGKMAERIIKFHDGSVIEGR